MNASLVLIDDHGLFLEGLKPLLLKTPGWSVAGSAADGPSAKALLESARPDLALVDLRFPGGDGVSLTRWIRETLPSTKVLVLTGEDDLSRLPEVLRAGAHGFIRKQDTAAELVRAVETVLSGGTYLSAEATNALVAEVKSPAARGAAALLSDRERQVLRLVAQGQRNKEIAGQLGLSVKAVEACRSRMLAKLELTSTAELIRYAVREGIAEA